MNFYDEILFKLGRPPQDAVGTKVFIVDMRAVYIEGHNGLKDLSPGLISFRYKKRILAVKGEKLKLNELSPDEAYVTGIISSVEVERV